jgi:hypothetical protein
VLVLRWLIDGTDVHLLARDAKISQATAYRYLHEAIDVIAEQAPDLTEVLAQGGRPGGPSSHWTAPSSNRPAVAPNPLRGLTCGTPASTTTTAETSRW